MDIDIGIDAQLEIFDESYNSTGNFINAQIKSTKGKKFKVQASKNNLSYWRIVDEPTILVNILDIKGDPKIYWMLMTKEICDEYLETFTNKPNQKLVSINFDNAKLLTIEDKSDFKTLHIKDILNNFMSKLKDFEVKYNSIFNSFDNSVSKHQYISNLMSKPDIDALDTYLLNADSGLELASEIILMVKEKPELISFIDHPFNIPDKKNDFIDLVNAVASCLHKYTLDEKSELLKTAKQHYKSAWKILSS